MTPEEHRETVRLFHEACELEDSDVAPFLDRACAGRRELREMLESLLASHAELRSLDQQPPRPTGPDEKAVGGESPGEL